MLQSNACNPRAGLWGQGSGEAVPSGVELRQGHVAQRQGAIERGIAAAKRWRGVAWPCAVTVMLSTVTAMECKAVARQSTAAASG